MGDIIDTDEYRARALLDSWCGACVRVAVKGANRAPSDIVGELHPFMWSEADGKREPASAGSYRVGGLRFELPSSALNPAPQRDLVRVDVVADRRVILVREDGSKYEVEPT